MAVDGKLVPKTEYERVVFWLKLTVVGIALNGMLFAAHLIWHAVVGR